MRIRYNLLILLKVFGCSAMDRVEVLEKRKNAIKTQLKTELRTLTSSSDPGGDRQKAIDAMQERIRCVDESYDKIVTWGTGMEEGVLWLLEQQQQCVLGERK